MLTTAQVAAALLAEQRLRPAVDVVRAVSRALVEAGMGDDAARLYRLELALGELGRSFGNRAAADRAAAAYVAARRGDVP